MLKRILYRASRTKLARTQPGHAQPEDALRRQLLMALGASGMGLLSSLPGTALAAPVCWTSGPAIPEGQNEVVGASVGDRLFVYGGVDGGKREIHGLFYAFDPKTNQWEKLKSNDEHVHHPAAIGVDGQFFLFGGFNFAPARDGGPPAWAPVDHASVYNARTGVWTKLPPMPSKRGAAAAAIVGRRIHVFGGAIAGTRTPEGLRPDWVVSQSTAHEVFDIDAGTWSTAAPMPTGRNHHGAAAVGDTIYVIGGRTGFFGGTFSNMAMNEAYNVKTDSWSALTMMPTARSGVAVIALNNRVHVLGGEAFQVELLGTFRTHEAYDPAPDIWTTEQRMPTPRHGFAAAQVGGRIIAVSGVNVPGGGGPATPLVVNEIYDQRCSRA